MHNPRLCMLAAVVGGFAAAPAPGQPPVDDAGSVECLVLPADVVVVGSVAAIVDADAAGQALPTLAVESTLEGEHRDRRQVALPPPRPRNFAVGDRLLVAAGGGPAARGAGIDPGARPLEVWGADLEPDAVIQAAGRAIGRPPGGGPIATCGLRVPGRLAVGTTWARTAYGTGVHLVLEVPVDERLERHARESLGGEDHLAREEGIRALRSFRSGANFALAKSPLDEPGRSFLEHAETNRGVEVRYYGVRDEALKTLAGWGIDRAGRHPDRRRRPQGARSTPEARIPGPPVHRGRGGAGFADLAPLRGLATLDLARTRVTDRDLPSLAGRAGPKAVDLGGTAVTDAGVAALVGRRPGLQVARQALPGGRVPSDPVALQPFAVTACRGGASRPASDGRPLDARRPAARSWKSCSSNFQPPKPGGSPCVPRGSARLAPRGSTIATSAAPSSASASTRSTA